MTRLTDREFRIIDRALDDLSLAWSRVSHIVKELTPSQARAAVRSIRVDSPVKCLLHDALIDRAEDTC